MLLFKILLFSAGSILFIIILAAAIYWLTLKYGISKFKVDESHEAVNGIYVIKNDTYINLHVVKNGEKYIVIDTGVNPEQLKKEMHQFGILPENVEAVFLTHTDYDHVGAVSLFENAKVYLPFEEEQMINGKTPRALFFKKNKLKCEYNLIKDNETINFSGLTVEGILTPGHTPGSMCYIVNNKYLFTGDVLYLKNNRAALPFKPFNMNSNEAEKSIEKLAKLKSISYIFTAHAGYSNNFELVFDKYIS
ncbi:MAG: MBL fold metallo-hydrolase [Bacillota bacterium]|mgnify:CR=1 FL=1|jgi:hydroxyacylglutathione hydrolase|nr:MBL fold metallo-hydrolase [Bacillota bacterium]NLV64038.1 MBL fold metallo-hydrolase [Clostridiaceae bacterium]